MKVISARELGERIMKVAVELDCQNSRMARVGKPDWQVDQGLFELMFILEFVPYWNAAQLWQKACYLNRKYGV
ncbi:hypothetical protein [Dyadobacter sp. BHUBP1]|uniref:hypothetical protein n=1 Tax=Dyadobacter sp. BHUBP1 TaxID=3424178 RepID=UPI003D335079